MIYMIYIYMYGFDFIDRIWMTWSSVSGCEWQHREQARQDNVQRTLYLYTFQTSFILMRSDVCPRTAATTWGHDWIPISEQHLLCVGPNKFEAGAHHDGILIFLRTQWRWASCVGKYTALQQIFYNLRMFQPGYFSQAVWNKARHPWELHIPGKIVHQVTHQTDFK